MTAEGNGAAIPFHPGSATAAMAADIGNAVDIAIDNDRLQTLVGPAVPPDRPPSVAARCEGIDAPETARLKLALGASGARAVQIGHVGRRGIARAPAVIVAVACVVAPLFDPVLVS